jgi:glycine cleavage system aminomethyltransferase T
VRCAYLDRMTVANVDRPSGRIMYTPVLTPNGGFRSDLTVVRLGGTTSGSSPAAPTGAGTSSGSATTCPPTARRTCRRHQRLDDDRRLGSAGPRHDASATSHDLSDAAFGFGTAQWVEIAGIHALMVRISYVGDLGWEIHAPIEQGERLWDTLWEAGRFVGASPRSAPASTARRAGIEKGYRLMGAELESEYDPVEAGLAFPKVKAADFIGKDAYLAAARTDPVAVMCSLTVEDHTSSAGIPRFPQGGEPC